MKLTRTQIDEINEFFVESRLAECFIELYNHQLSLCGDIFFENRDKIIGFRCEGEHLRAYVGRAKDGSFFLKTKTALESIPFEAANAKKYKQLLTENNGKFENDIELYTLTVIEPPEPKQKKKKAKSKAKKPTDTAKKPSQKSIEKKNVVLSKLKNRQRARKFTEEEFYELADWTYCSSFNEDGYIYTLPNGNRIECDSKSELTILKYLVSKKLALAIGGQELCIKYDTAYRTGCDYFPDIVILTKDNHIAIIEVKPVTSMSYHINMEKYTALQEYCEQNGYEYMMVDPDHNYMTFEELQKTKVPSVITARVMSYLRNVIGKEGQCLLEKEDIPVLYEDFAEDYKKGEFELYLHALIIQKGWYNKFKHGFMVFETPQQ